MRKIIIIVIVLILIGAFVMRQTDFNNNQNVSVSPTTTVANVQIPEGWQKYEDEKLGVSFAVPEDFEIENNGDYSVTAKPSVNKDNPAGDTRFFYVSVVPSALINDETAQVYNYSSSFHKKLLSIPVGEIRNLSEIEGQKDYYMYERNEDELYNGQKAKVFVNRRPWEFPSGTLEYRYVFEMSQKTVIVGAYIEGEPTETQFDLPLLTQIMKTLLIIE